MRTTLSIDDDVLAAARATARREHRSVGDVVSALARSALVARQQSTEGDFYGFRPLPSRGGIVTDELIDELREDEGV